TFQEDMDYSKPIEVASGVFWVGFVDDKNSLHCNPYLIIEGDEAVLIDGGSRPEFSTVMIKILQTGINPSQIKRLIYQHYDPDLCGSIPHLEEIIGTRDLKIISHAENNIFIKHYGVKSPRLCIDTIERKYIFASGRELQFFRTPYAHSAGSFITFDTASKTLFTSDLFGGYDVQWDLFLSLSEKCHNCTGNVNCQESTVEHCPISGIILFHQRIMPSNKALQYALQQIKQLPAERIAPQHGSIIEKQYIPQITKIIEKITNVGIDGFINGNRT
ncbi:MAG: oxygen-binding di-iron domain-containing protein, partial [Mobilitalea sp.]